MKKDLTTKILTEYPDVFADIGNVCLFNGRKYIKPEDLELCPQEVSYKEADGQFREHRGDVRMRPKDMLDIPQNERNIWESLVVDHKIHLIDLSRQSDEEVSRYKSDLWYIVKCLKCGKDKEKYKDFLAEGMNRKMQHPEAVIDMITAFAGKTKAKKLADQVICEQKEEGGECTMYSFLDYFEEVGMEKGLEQGLEQGIEKGQEQLYYRMFSKNRTPEDISDFTGESVEYLYNLKEKYLATVREESHYDGNGKR